MHISTTTSQPLALISSADNAPARTVTDPETKVAHNEKVFHDTFTMITDRYRAFNPTTELGFQQRPGVTADIEPISKQDLVSILEHIKTDDTLFKGCKDKSAKAAFFNKFYLMSNPDQGWNLRLHNFSVRGSGLGEEDSPHYHRWTLASKILSGGYLNVNYQEGPKTDSTPLKDAFSKYELSASKSQTNAGTREARYISEAEMKVKDKTLYAQGGLEHFPLATPHSVEAHSGVMGTTLTLAHTSKPALESSISFKRSNNIEAISEKKIESNDEFEAMLQMQITHLQVLILSDDLNASLMEKFEQRSSLTAGEEKHLADYKEPNYVETSFLPALAIYQMETTHGMVPSEFSEDTVELIEIALKEMDPDALARLISNNQLDLWDQQLTIEVDDPELAKQLGERASQATVMH
ncbi:hypothetical protein ACI2KG_07410 [Pseudomonas sp. NPDC089407]|uniref:hypothetical protein n=1 Tax=Pseudomonas sp. NPDC089407 TaxID=3364464 RepID=UPI00385122F1